VRDKLILFGFILITMLCQYYLYQAISELTKAVEFNTIHSAIIDYKIERFH